MKITRDFFVLSLFSLVLFSSFSLLSCAGTPVKEPVYSDSDAVKLDVPVVKKQKSMFSAIDPRVMDLAQRCTPSAINQAASLLHKTDTSTYTEGEKVLLATLKNVMEIVYPSETVYFDVPPVGTNNSYLGAIDSARRGIYDSSTGNVDFFATVLPALVLLTSKKNDNLVQIEESLEQCLKSRRDSGIVLYLMGILQGRKENYSKSVEYFEEVLHLEPENFEIKNALAFAQYKNKNYESCLATAEAILPRYPQNVELIQLCANASFLLGNLEKTESYVVRVLLLEPENLDFVLFRAKILMIKSDYIRASSLLDVYERSSQTSRDYLILRARLQREWNKNVNAASETISKALSLYPHDEEVLLFAGELAASANITINGKNALDFSSEILTINPNDVSALTISINQLMKNSKWTEAYNLSSKLVSDSGAGNETKANHVDICLALNRTAEALSLSKDIYSQNPEDEVCQQTYIKTLVTTSQKTTALTLINQLMPVSRSTMKSFLYYQRSFLSTSEDEALGDLRSSLTSNPRNKDSLYRLYEIYYSKKDYRRAQYYLKQVVALDSSNNRLLQKNAELDSLLGR